MRGRRIINRKKFIKGLLILLLSPLVALALLAAYVYWANSRPQTEQLRTTVEPQVVPPGWEATYYITFAGEEPKPNAPPPTVDMVFLIDVSGSMTSSLPAMAEAAHRVAQELSSEKGRIRFSLIRFDTEAEVTAPWTEDPEVLYAGLKRLEAFTGGNDTRAAFARLDELLAKSRPGAKKVAIFYTDGVLEACNPQVFNSPCPFGPMTNGEMVKKAAELRAGGVDFYSIGLPGHGSAPLMFEMTGSPSHIFDPVDAGDLATNFSLVARGMIGGLGESGQIFHLLDGRHFATPLGGTPWSMDSGGALNLSVGKLPKTATTYAHPLVPLSSGLWRVGVAPPRLILAAEGGGLLTLNAERRPLLLVVGWLPLLWGLLPAALWTLLYLTQRTPQPLELSVPPPDILRPRPPTLLPALPADRASRDAPVPTLFIGIGGAGRRSLLATRAELKQAHLGLQSAPYRFLWIDVDTKQAAQATSFEEWSEYPVKELIAPAAIRRAQDYLPAPAQTPEHLSWFDAQRYLNASREELNLSDGTRGDRALARLALFQWLAQDSALLAELEGVCRDLARENSVDGTRQIVIYASPDGGVGSGWFLDIGRLLHRITRRQQEESETDFIPEIVGVLSDTPDGANHENRSAVETEFGSAALAGAFPQRTTYAPGRELLDGVDKESPYNWVFNTSAYDLLSAASQSAELAAVLVERHPRASLLKASDSLPSGQFISAQARSVRVLPAQLYERVRCEIFLRSIGPEILLDLEAAARGGFALKGISEEAAARRLTEWAAAEPPGTPLQQLLAAAADGSATPGFMRIMQGGTPPMWEWFVSVLSNSMTLRLRGHADPDDSTWHRDWMLGEAVAILRLLSKRLAETVLPEAQMLGAPAHAAEVIGRAGDLACATADQLEVWGDEFCAACEKFTLHHGDLSRISGELRRLSGRTYLEPLDGQEQVERAVTETFKTWLGTPDIISAIRERLFFAAVPEGNSARVVLRAYVNSREEFSKASDAIDALDAQARLLARAVPAIRIGGALAKEPQGRLKQLADQMVDTTTAPHRVLLVFPKTSDGDEARTLNEFRQLVPQPPGHGTRAEQSGDDQTAVRRLELTPKVFRDDGARTTHLYAADAEQRAELLRSRAENKYRTLVPAFPPELRIALTRPAAFVSFARAYKAGHVVLREDAAGTRQWAFLDTGEFLTFGPEPTLAQAAANYASHVGSPSRAFDVVGKGGAFIKVAEWRKNRGSADDDTLTLIAIDVFEG